MRHFIALAVIALVGCTVVQSATLSRRDVKSDLIKKGQDLLKQADAEIKKLSADPKQAHEVTVLKSEEAKIKKLTADLEAATDDAQIKKLETELNAAENKLKFEIQKIEHKTTPATKDPKAEALLKKAKTLEKQAEDLVKKLKADGKTTEVAELEKDEALVKKLVKELEVAETKTGTDLTTIEKELTAAEARLAKEIKKDTPTSAPTPAPTPAKRDAKADLIKKGQDLLKLADDEIKKLSADPKQAHEVTVLKSEEAKIKKLTADLEAATDAAKITKLEADLNTAENKLKYEIEKIAHKAAPKDQKEKLLKKAQALEKQAEDLIKKLKEEKKDTEVAAVEKDEALVKKYVKELQDAKEGTDLTTIEKELNEAEKRLAKDIKKDTPTSAPTPAPTPAPKPAKRDAKADLIKKGEDLLKQADAEIKKLSADPKQAHEVTVLKSEEAKIKKLTADLQAATDDAQIKKLETELNAAENKLKFEIQKIEHKTTPATKDPKAEALLKKAKTLEKQAEDLVKKLKADGKTTEVAELEKDEALVKKLVKELEVAETKTGTDLTTIEKELTAAEARLAKEIKKDTAAPTPAPTSA